SQLSSPAAKAAFDVASDDTTEARALIRTKPRLRAIPAMTRDSGDLLIAPAGRRHDTVPAQVFDHLAVVIIGVLHGEGHHEQARHRVTSAEGIGIARQHVVCCHRLRRLVTYRK